MLITISARESISAQEDPYFGDVFRLSHRTGADFVLREMHCLAPLESSEIGANRGSQW
jgi:hypothetical protein